MSSHREDVDEMHPHTPPDDPTASPLRVEAAPSRRTHRHQPRRSPSGSPRPQGRARKGGPNAIRGHPVRSRAAGPRRSSGQHVPLRFGASHLPNTASGASSQHNPPVSPPTQSNQSSVGGPTACGMSSRSQAPSTGCVEQNCELQGTHSRGSDTRAAINAGNEPVSTPKPDSPSGSNSALDSEVSANARRSRKRDRTPEPEPDSDFELPSGKHHSRKQAASPEAEADSHTSPSPVLTPTSTPVSSQSADKNGQANNLTVIVISSDSDDDGSGAQGEPPARRTSGRIRTQPERYSPPDTRPDIPVQLDPLEYLQRVTRHHSTEGAPEIVGDIFAMPLLLPNPCFADLGNWLWRNIMRVYPKRTGFSAAKLAIEFPAAIRREWGLPEAETEEDLILRLPPARARTPTLAQRFADAGIKDVAATFSPHRLWNPKKLVSTRRRNVIALKKPKLHRVSPAEKKAALLAQLTQVRQNMAAARSRLPGSAGPSSSTPIGDVVDLISDEDNTSAQAATDKHDKGKNAQKPPSPSPEA